MYIRFDLSPERPDPIETLSRCGGQVEGVCTKGRADMSRSENVVRMRLT